jgi:aryl-alcohol dehydrogenase-like predicted oxidoreductase
MNIARRLMEGGHYHGPLSMSGNPVAALHRLLRDQFQLRTHHSVQKKPAGFALPERARRLGLGTVQFAQRYGISNRRGQVPADEVRAILACAAGAGLGLLDTAANYGEAEAVLSEMDTSGFRLVSKTASIALGVDAVVARVRQSARALGRLDLLLVHSAGDLLGPQGERLWRALGALKLEGVTAGIGISAYVDDNPAWLAERFRPDAMQVPCSILDQRLLRDGSLERLKQLGVEVHARSVFLQGLLFLESFPERLRYAQSALESARARIAAAGTTPLAAALAFVLSRPEVDVAVVGVAALKHLQEILAAVCEPVPELDWETCALDDARILTPSLWDLGPATPPHVRQWRATR